MLIGPPAPMLRGARSARPPKALSYAPLNTMPLDPKILLMLAFARAMNGGDRCSTHPLSFRLPPYDSTTTLNGEGYDQIDKEAALAFQPFVEAQGRRLAALPHLA
jgi:hypothetical protein